ncbi:MAG: hypothetical protein LBN99_07045 [Oscillospiraceae bacterium]|jgi:hypothetical protein|nr:hypothetical protein [Oscillospiraceae bacterium]
MKRIPKEKVWGGTAAKYDERQLQIRSVVFTRTWVMTAVLLLACSFVEGGLEVEWALPWQTHLIVAAAATAYSGIELLLRGAYFERNGMTGWGVPYMLAALSLISTVWHIVDFARGEKIAENGALTVDGGFFVTTLLLLAFGVVGVVKSRQLRKHWEKPDEE